MPVCASAEMGEARRYLIVGPAWVGDMVMAQSLLISLKQAYPDSLIDVVAPAWSLPLLARMPEVHRGIGLPVGHGAFGLGERFRLGRSLRAEHYSHAIVLPRSWKSALVPWFAGAGQRTGYRGEMRYGLLNDIRALNKSILTRTVQRYVALGMPDSSVAPTIPPPRLRVNRDNQQRQVRRLGLDSDRPVVAIMPGAEYGPAKQWPYYAALAAALVEQDYAVWLLGSEKDSAVCAAIDQASGGRTHDLSGQTELVDVIDLLAAATVAVSNDSGLMHVAAAVQTPLVAIYGSSSPDYTPPLTARATVLSRHLACSPCFKRSCPLGHTECLTGIPVTDVIDAVMASVKNTD